jgi:ubiquinone/menaquinone biosynthesis C-methylase UbiE
MGKHSRSASEQVVHIPQGYSDPDYWNKRYLKQSSSEEWYDRFAHFEPKISPFLRRTSRVLHIGCGNSTMSVDLVKFGCGFVDAIDLSDVVIEQMKHKYVDEPNVQWHHADCMALPFPKATYDAAFDKGTMDALLCSETASANVKAMFMEVIRTLKPSGIFVEISLAGPDDRLSYFRTPGLRWKMIHLETVPGFMDAPTYVYIFQKSR